MHLKLKTISVFGSTLISSREINKVSPDFLTNFNFQELSNVLLKPKLPLNRTLFAAAGFWKSYTR
jgi:hypothetical protein